MLSSIRVLPVGYIAAMLLWLAAGVAALWLLLRLRRSWKEKPKRLKIVHGLLSLWMLLAAVTAFELYFALFYDQSDSFNMTNVSKKWFDLHVRPDQKTLEFGDGWSITFRDEQRFPDDVPADRRHLCFVGDSFTFGHGVPDASDRFTDRIRRSLERRFPGEFVVTNLANAGTDLFWVEDLVEHLLRESGPRVDTFVYVLCLNDIENFAGENAEFYRRLGDRNPRCFLFRDTYFLNLMYFRAMQFTTPEVRNYYGYVREFYAGEPWRRMREKLVSVARMCEVNGTGFRVVVFPFLHNLGEDDGFREIHLKIAAFCREGGIPVLDLEPVLAAHAAEVLTVNRFDAHPNERAHALAAEAIEDWLISPAEGPSRK